MSDLLWILLFNQIVMGAFDTIYHHELAERLPWRASQGHELALHAIRSLLYATVLVVLGWLELHGIWTLVLLAVLTVEVVITLMDFVEEDLTRALPASERINHTLLALNYGAILALLVPVLLGWLHQPTAIKTAWHGFWSVFMAISAAGVLICGARDFFAARRARRLIPGRAAELVAALPERQHVLVTGATGFIGSRLTEALASAGHRVTVLVRDPKKAAQLTPPFRLITSLDRIANDERIDAIVNLAGEPIANAPWTLRKRRRILRSRLEMTRHLVRLIGRLETPPALLVSGSAIGWYGLWQDEALTEFDGGKACFSHRLCDAWERMAMRAQAHGTRVVRLRIGLVLGTEGGMLARMLTPFELGLGGPLGSGAQWMSWIERDDLVRLIAHIMVTRQLNGAVNATAPVPVRNAEFTRELGRAFRRPAFTPMPAFVLRLLGDLADELLLGGQQVLPDKALANGFKFRHETLRSALTAMLPRPDRPADPRPSHSFRVATPETKA
ncbi:MAG: TIGR01777 family oxidoreductase [Xanthobacteraceae bacterium]|nr:TIGR01777 family oxidoreductase [Xanthobacteraceae bacterium]